MNIRSATPTDRDAIRDIARRSLTESYSFDPSVIDAGISEWYSTERFNEKLSNDEYFILLAEHHPPSGPRIVGFTEITLTETDVADILWLHVDPRFRDLGIGAALFEHAQDTARAAGATQIRGRVLAENPDGNAFYADRGLVQTAETVLDVGAESYTENIYVEVNESLRLITAENDTELYVDPDLTETGSTGPFYAVFSDPTGRRRWGYFCATCDSVVTTMDTMDRIECMQCGNTRKPTRWDAAYL